jgi:DedD protein
MDKQQLKKRLVGAIVLVALGIIFIPMILSGDHDSGTIWGTNIPDKPKPLQELAQRPIPEMPVPPPPPAETRDLVDNTSKSDKTPATPAPSEPPQTKPEATAVTTMPSQPANPAKVEQARAWVVQVGSFSQQANAISLRDKLRKHKFTAFVESIQSFGSTVYRVRVGPHVLRTDAEAQQASLAKQLNVKGVVLAHP